jgi:hypothetical protein
MADLDRELSSRLSRLAEAVPPSRGQLDPVHRTAVAARQRVRMAWLTPIVVLLALILGAKLAGINLGPGTSAPPSTDPLGTAAPGAPTARDEDGAFSLEIRAGKARYAPGEPIDVAAALLYAGPHASVAFRHDTDGPIVFGIEEKVFGAISVGEISDLMWHQTTLQRGTPMVQPFQKGGGFSGDHPEASMLSSWLTDPVLTLPAGTWHLYAHASGTTADNDKDGSLFSLGAVVEILVADDAAATPGLPAPTAWNDQPVYGGDDVGSAGLQLKSEHPRYQAGAPIELSAWYWFNEGHDLVASHFAPELSLSIEQLDAKDPTSRGTVFDSACTDLGHVEGVERHIPIEPSTVGLVRADELPASNDELFKDGSLRLPAGHWRISASVSGTFGPCANPGEPYAMHASLEIDVVAGSAAAPSPSPAASGSSVQAGDFDLSLVAAKPTFSTDEPVAVQATLTYRGPQDHVTVYADWWGPITFGLTGASGVNLTPRGPGECPSFELTRGVPYVQRLVDFKAEPRSFELPHGLYEITAAARFAVGSCNGTQRLDTKIDIAVSAGADDVPIWNQHSEPGACLLLFGGGRLTADAASGMGVVDGNGTFHVVIWPAGYSARRSAEGSVLLRPDGEAIAHVGDQVSFDASMATARPVVPCGPVTRVGP